MLHEKIIAQFFKQLFIFCKENFYFVTYNSRPTDFSYSAKRILGKMHIKLAHSYAHYEECAYYSMCILFSKLKSLLNCEAYKRNWRNVCKFIELINFSDLIQNYFHHRHSHFPDSRAYGL